MHYLILLMRTTTVYQIFAESKTFLMPSNFYVGQCKKNYYKLCQIKFTHNCEKHCINL